VIFLGDFSFVRIFLKNYRVTMTTTLDTFGKYNGFVNKARVSACMYFLVLASDNFLHSIETHLHDTTLGIYDFYPGVCRRINACRDIWSENLSTKSETNNGGNRRDIGRQPSPFLLFLSARSDMKLPRMCRNSVF
jgi:hypothetical protein